MQRMINTCPLGCNSELKITDLVLDEGALRCCENCGQFVSSCTAEQYEISLRKWNAAGGTLPKSHEQARYRKVSQRILHRALQLLNQKSSSLKLLDVGCSSGALLTIITEMGFIASGVEPALEAAQTAKKAGFDVYQGYLTEANYPSETFDIITLFEIIEHITNPMDMLNECHRILKPGGILMLSTPNSASWTARFMKKDWEGFNLTKMGGHISIFSPKSIIHLANKTGFKVERIETKSVRFFEKDQCHPICYKIAKMVAELLAYPAKLASSGQGMLVYLHRKN